MSTNSSFVKSQGHDFDQLAVVMIISAVLGHERSVGRNSYIHLECVLDCDCAGLPPAVDIARTPSFVL